MSAVIIVVAWCVLAVVSAVQFGVVPRFSASERARLMRQGDKAAREEQTRLDTAPLLQSVIVVIRIIFISLFITYCVLAYGVAWGVVLGTVLVIALPVSYRLSFVCSTADRLADLLRAPLTKVALALKPVFSALRSRDSGAGEVQLNSQEELLHLVKHSPGILTGEEFERLVANLSFDSKKVADIMTPRSVIEAVPLGETLGPLVLDELYKTGHSRFPVYDKDLDHIVGMLYLHDLLDLRQGSQPAKEAMQTKVYFVREDRDLSHALHGFLKTKHHLFVVVNEYRETVGLLSLEDVIEALVGVKITDEFDAFDDLRAVAEHNPRANNEPKGKEDI